MDSVKVAGAAAAGFVVSRMLLAKPGPGLLERFSDSKLWSSWPVANQESKDGLQLLSAGFASAAVETEWDQLFSGGPGKIELRESQCRESSETALVAELAKTYQSDGFSPGHSAGQPEDHLGLELMYLAHLGTVLARANPASAGLVQAKLNGFRAEHVDPVWAVVAPQIGDRAQTAVFRALPGLVTGFLAALTSELSDSAPAVVSADAR